MNFLLNKFENQFSILEEKLDSKLQSIEEDIKKLKSDNQLVIKPKEKLGQNIEQSNEQLNNFLKNLKKIKLKKI